MLDDRCGSEKLVRFLRRPNVEAFELEPAEPLFSIYLSDNPVFAHKTLEEYAADSNVAQLDDTFTLDVIKHVEQPDLLLRIAPLLLRTGVTPRCPLSRYAHLSRQNSLGYTPQYLADFVVGAGRIRISDRLERFLASLNRFDTMSVVLQKMPNPSEEKDTPMSTEVDLRHEGG